MTSCQIRRSMFYASSSHVDYRPYSEKGFFITEANSVSFEYTPISSVLAITRSVYSTNELIAKSIDKKDRDNSFVEASAQDALEELYKKAKDLGANGIVNLKITSFTETGTSDVGHNINLVGYSASVMAVRCN